MNNEKKYPNAWVITLKAYEVDPKGFIKKYPFYSISENTGYGGIPKKTIIGGLHATFEYCIKRIKKKRFEKIYNENRYVLKVEVEDYE
jgi:hypothetical protein